MSARTVPVLLMILVLPAHAAERAPCSIHGEPLHWIADYCMAKLQTDDEIPAMPCIEAERQRAFPSACDAKRHYKRALCQLAASPTATRDDVQRCVDDPAFVGSTVRNGGVGR